MKKRALKKKNSVNKTENISRVLYWTPRVLSILFILFIAMFSLDIFGNNYTFWETVVGLFMHNIPTFVLIIFLIIAWKWEWVGAVGYILAGILYMALVTITSSMDGFKWYYLSWSILIAGPAIIVGILWWINWIKKR
ncbi:Uncharacterised protein [uncultured archaeon]|nr:Uncharacterised protein [uncultured archaeon]